MSLRPLLLTASLAGISAFPACPVMLRVTGALPALCESHQSFSRKWLALNVEASHPSRWLLRSGRKPSSILYGSKNFRHIRVCPSAVGMRAASSSPADAEQAACHGTLHVYLFLTVVGFGKNSMMDQICEMQHDEVMKIFSQRKHPVILESDVIGAKKFWKEVDKQIQDPELGSHLFLNKNFPPNAWKGAKEKLARSCEKRGRKLELHAVVPSSSGTSVNPFSLQDLAVCMSSVQTREGHPNLGKDQGNTAAIAAMFYNLYFTQGGRQAFVAKIKRDLTESVIEVEWIKPSSFGKLGAEIKNTVYELLRKARLSRDDLEGQKELEAESRAFFEREEVASCLKAVRRSPEEIHASFISSLAATLDE